MLYNTQTESIITQTASACGFSSNTGVYALAAAVNPLAAAGVHSWKTSIDVSIRYPHLADKSPVYQMKKRLQKECRKRGILSGEIVLSENRVLKVAEVTVTAVGAKEKPDPEKCDCAESDGYACRGDGEELGHGRHALDVVMAGWAGMEGMLRIVDEKETALKERFGSSFLTRIREYQQYLFTGERLASCAEEAVSIRQIREGGIFAGLFALAKETGVGLEIDLKWIPVLQETIEVCEYFRLNPYQMASAGSFLLLAEDGETLSGKLRQKNVQASVIGKTTEFRDKIIKNGEDVRYIDRPAPDEIYQIF